MIVVVVVVRVVVVVVVVTWCISASLVSGNPDISSISKGISSRRDQTLIL